MSLSADIGPGTHTTQVSYTATGAEIAINSDPQDGYEEYISGTSSSTSFTGSGTQGLLYPKYLVVGVTYAPPGANSYVQYTNTTSVGTTSTNQSSFSNTLGYSIQVQASIGISAGETLADGGVQLTATQSTDYTQTQNSSTSVTFNKSVSIADKAAGYPTTNSPDGPLSPALPNDYDVIWLWLNPELVFTAFPAGNGVPAAVQWNGYAYDPSDTAGPDIYPVQAGCLNGDFSDSYCATQQGVLNRSWVQGRMSPTTGASVTAAGCPNGTQSPSICPNTEDAYNILSADPLASNPGGSAYTLFNSSPLPVTTSDGRFTQYPFPPNPVFYESGQTLGYTVTQMNTQQQSQGGSSQVKVTVSVSEQAETGFLSLFSEKTTWTESDTVSTTNTWLTTLNQQQTVQNAFSISGSNPPNYVDGEFIVYQDNQYGTFLCVPWQ